MDWWILKVYYTDSQLAASGLTESSLRLQYYDEEGEEWIVYTGDEGGVNTTGNYVWANLTHFSTFGLFGNPVTTTSRSMTAMPLSRGSARG